MGPKIEPPPTTISLSWAKIRNFTEPCIICNNTYLIACDDIVRFCNIVTNEETYYRADGGSNGDGIASAVGHRHLPIFAFSELCIRPQIFVLTFPDFRKINVLKSNHHERYKNVRFSDTEYLLALSGLPRHSLEIWNWRLGKLLGSVETGIFSAQQILRPSRTNPVMVGQYAADIGVLLIWEIHLSTEQACLIKRPTTIPFLNRDIRVSFTFGVDNTLYVVDNIGNLHGVIPSVGVSKLLWEDTNSPGLKKTLISSYRNGLAVYGSSGRITFLKKQDSVFSVVWQVSSDLEFEAIRTLNNQLVGITTVGGFEILDETGQKTEQDQNQLSQPEENHEIGIRNFEFIYPMGTYAAVEIGFKEIELIECSTGRIVALTKLQNIVCMRSHPQYPFIAVGNQTGRVILLSYFTPEKPKIITKFHLSETWIEVLRFAPSGEVLVVGDRFGDFYIIKGKIGGRMEVTTHFNFEHHVLYLAAQTSADILHVLLLSNMNKDADNQIASNKARRIAINLMNQEMTEITIQLSDRYTSLTASATNPKQFIATPYLKRDIHILEMHGDTMKSVEVIATFSQLPYLEVYSDMNYIVTWGMDGIVSIFDASSNKMDAVYIAQNRYSHRTRNVRVDPSRKYAISLGIQGSMKCFRIDPNFANSTKMNELQTTLQSDFMESLFTNSTRGFIPSGEDAGKTWLEIKRKKDFKREQIEFKQEKKEIYKEFLDLKEKLKELIDTNEEWPENERLPLQNFNLSKEWAESLFEVARQERELEDRAMKAYVADQNRITQWIIDNTWNRMAVQGYKIRGMFSSIRCENYPLLHTDKGNDEDMKKVLLWLNVENMVAKVDKFQPWIPRAVQKTIESLAQSPDYVDEEAVFKHSASSSETEVQDSSQEHIRLKRIKYALSGTSTHNFIDPISNRYEQLDVVTFEQTFVEKILGQSDMYNLRVLFNKQFNALYKFKEDQMDQVGRRNDRLRTIQNELNILAQLKGTDEHYDDFIVDPQYQFDEQPDKIIKVDDSEVKVLPYISPSRQKILDEEAHQLELKRLALLADDFRERALIIMMDGVLEKRWEDEIKKTPPQPECLRSGKSPNEYTKDEARAVNEYEAQLKTLQAERDKYRLMLLEEKTKIQHLQSEMIMKFNMRCASLFMLKHQVDAAVKQEELKLLRNSLNNYERIVHKRKELNYMNELAQKKKEIEITVQVIEDLEKRVADCRARYDQLQTRDRLLDRQFKTQFGENAPPVIVDQAYKIFKKRPKWMPRSWATAAILQDIANRIVTKNYTKSGGPLPDECYEFLSMVETLENISSAPNSIVPNLWNILCQLRRHKMESEFKLKAQGIQLAEAEATLNTFTKELASKKAKVYEIEKERDEFRQTYSNNLLNRSIQLVMPRGVIEVTLTGRMSDFKGSILLHTSDIDDINDIIKKAGEIKLRTMNRSAIFRRKIICKEWEHKMLQMEVKNMKDYLAIIEKCKVTKEVQTYLKRKDLGLPEDLSQSALNREIEATRAYVKKSLDEINAAVAKVSSQLESKRLENKFLDAEIARINVDVTEQNLLRDFTMEEKERQKKMDRMATVVERGKLIRKVQAQHAQILELGTMLELQRLRTFPTLHAPKRNPFP